MKTDISFSYISTAHIYKAEGKDSSCFFYWQLLKICMHLHMHVQRHLPKPVFDTTANAVLLFFPTPHQLHKIPDFVNKQTAFITISFSWFRRAGFFSKLEIWILQQSAFSMHFLLYPTLRWVTTQCPFIPVSTVFIKVFSSVFPISSAQRWVQLCTSICACSITGFRLRKMLCYKSHKLLSSFSSFINLQYNINLAAKSF